MDGLSEAVLTKLRQAWRSSLAEARLSEVKLSKTHHLRSPSIVGHVITLVACMETVVNRHLFHLRESGQLDSHHYASLDRVELLPKILFAFKEQVSTKRLSTSNLKYLISLRNNAVHFKETSIDSIAPTAEELLRIWREVGQLFSFIEGEPTQTEVGGYADEFLRQWVEHRTQKPEVAPTV